MNGSIGICDACCSNDIEEFARARVLDRFDALYLRCAGCGMITVDEPTWLPEAYERSIATTDVGIVQRAYSTALVSRLLLVTAARSASSMIDIGSGPGLFVRFMRDSGFPFEYHDAYGPNLYAQGHEGDPERDHEFVTAFEVLEHLTAPEDELGQILNGCDFFLATTSLASEIDPPSPDEWRYYALDTGQHVRFWTKTALDAFAAKFGMRCVSRGDVHLMHRLRRPARLLLPLLSSRLAEAVAPFTKRPSLREADAIRASELL